MISNRYTVSARSPAYKIKTMGHTFTAIFTKPRYFSDTHAKVALNPLKNHPKRKFHIFVKKSGFSWWRSIIAQSAGERVSETMPEKMVETAIVSANWR